MKCKLLQDIRSACEYNAGGLTHIYLLEIGYFQSYRFRNDGLYDESYVEKLFRTAPWVKLTVENESKFTETLTKGIYKQEAETFVRPIDAQLISWLQRVRERKFLVVFRTRLGRYFTFGSDGGVNLNFSGQTGQVGDVNGVNLKISKESKYPHFEVDEATIAGHDFLSEYLPDFDYSYCAQADFIPQYDTASCLLEH